MALDTHSGESLGRAQTGKLVVIFDGACPRCRNSIKGLREFGNTENLELIDLRDPIVTRRFPSLSGDELLREIHAIDDSGRIWRGAEAIHEVLSRQRGIGRALSWLWSIPGAGRLAEYEYRRIAAARCRENAHSHRL